MNPGIYKNPSIEIFNIRVDEPVTMLTDVLVSAVCFYAYWELMRLEVRNRIHFFYRAFFLLMGLATFWGGLIGHSFVYALSLEWKIPGWFMSMFAIAFAERACILYAKPLIKKGLGEFFTWLNIVELILFMIISVWTLNFYFVVGHSAYGLVIVMASFQWYVYYRTGHKGSLQFLYAVIWSALGALIFINQWAISKWFNHIDIGHVLMAMSSWNIYKGAVLNLQQPNYVADEENTLA
ncbi:MAG: hypothetical protein AAGD28_14765 [Bacteroidota bacterium]